MLEREFPLSRERTGRELMQFDRIIL